MTDTADYPAILAVIETGIRVARDNPMPDKPETADNFAAYCVIQELRRAGWNVVRIAS